MGQFAPDGGVDPGGIGEGAADSAANCPRDYVPINAVPCHILESEGISAVTRQSFVGSFARQDDLHSLMCQLRHEIERNARGPDDRLVFVPDKMRQAIEEILLADENFVVKRIQMLG